MSRKCHVLIGVFCLLYSSGSKSSSASTLDSLKLHQYCKLVGIDNSKLSNEEYDYKNICLFYVSGVLDGYAIGGSKLRICTPDEASLGELALVVSKYLDEYPEKLHNAPEYLVIDALYKAFPCK